MVRNIAPTDASKLSNTPEGTSRRSVRFPRLLRARFIIGVPLVIACAYMGVRLLFANTPDIVLPPPLPLPAGNVAPLFVQAGRLVQQRGSNLIVSVPNVSTAVLRREVARNADALALYHANLDKPFGFPEVRSWKQRPGLHLEEVALAQLVQAEGRVYQADHQWKAAAQCYLDLYRWAQGFGKSGELIEGLVQILIQAISVEPMDKLLDQCDESTRRLIGDRLLSLVQSNPSLGEAMRRYGIAQVAQAQEWGRGEGWRSSQRLTGGSILSLYEKVCDDLQEARRHSEYRLNKLEVLKEYLRYQESLAVRASTPSWKRRTLKQISPPALFGAQPLYLSAFEDSDRKTAAAQRIIIKARLLLYVQAHHGVMPVILEALGLPPAVTTDPFTGHPLIYRRWVETGRISASAGIRCGFEIYSVGPNGVNDNGDPRLDINGPIGM
jgi:hypothetical protein